MGWFGSKDSVRALRKRGEGAALLRQVCDGTRSAEDRTKALRALAELAAAQGACRDALETLKALLELILGNEFHQLRETFIALFVQLANANKYADRTPAADIGKHHEYLQRQFLEEFADTRVVLATLKRQREYYHKPKLGTDGAIDAYKEYDPDRMKLLPLALLLCAGREREQLAFMARDPNPVFRACFLELLPKAGDLAQLPFILESTTDAFAEVRQRAFRALVVIGQPMAPKLVEFLEARAADSPDLVDFCAKVFNQPKFKLLATLIEQGRSRLGSKPEPKAVAALGRLYEQFALLKEPEAKPVALALFQKLSTDNARAELLVIACRMLDPEVAAHKARLEELARADHPCREEANRRLVQHRLGGLDPCGGELNLHDLPGQARGPQSRAHRGARRVDHRRHGRRHQFDGGVHEGAHPDRHAVPGFGALAGHGVDGRCAARTRARHDSAADSRRLCARRAADPEGGQRIPRCRAGGGQPGEADGVHRLEEPAQLAGHPGRGVGRDRRLFRVSDTGAAGRRADRCARDHAGDP